MQHGYLYDLLRKLGLNDFGARTGEFVLVRPLKVALLLLLTMVLARFARRLMKRSVRSVHHRTPLRPQTPRSEQRAETVGEAVGSVAAGAVWVVGVLLVLDQIGINLAPLIAGAGIVGVAVGFGAQSLVKDFLSGLFILLEDQYGVGDIVTLGESTGTVEDITLRVTRFRSVDGTVWFVPNGEIRGVGNASMEWSRALIDVQVAYDSDVAAVSEAIAEEAHAFAAEEAWAPNVLDPPEVWGVQAMGPDGLTIRLVLRTAPRQQYAVARELRTRISSRLRRDGVKGPGQTVIVTAGALDQGTPPPPPLESDQSPA